MTSTLEPGKSGVGDYVVNLATQCQREGHECFLIALNDEYVLRRERSSNDFETIKNTASPRAGCLRLSSGSSWAERMRVAMAATEKFDPEWICIQFVCYGYQSRGLVWGLAERFQRLCQGRKVEIMFHELWLGEGQGASWKHRLIGQVQKRLVINLIHQLQPAVIHVNCSAYHAILKRNGVEAMRLPLFGSVPISDGNGVAWLLPRLREGGVAVSAENRRRFWFFGLFGSLHPEWEAEPLFSYLREAARREDKHVVVLSIGRRGGAGDQLWKKLAAMNDDRLRLVDVGELPADKVSEVFQSLDVGIAATPQGLIGKSGSAAAMIEHGLPVIVTRDDFRLCFPFEPEEMRDSRFIPLGPDLIEDLSRAVRGPVRSELGAITKRFLADLTAK